MIKKIVLSEDEHEFIDHLVKREKNLQCTLQDISALSRRTNEELWEKLKKMFPDAIGVGKSAVLDVKEDRYIIRYEDDK